MCNTNLSHLYKASWLNLLFIKYKIINDVQAKDVLQDYMQNL